MNATTTVPRRRFPRRAHAGRIGLGVLCFEAQADGVPCTELGRECAVCERALRDQADRAEMGDLEDAHDNAGAAADQAANTATRTARQ